MSSTWIRTIIQGKEAQRELTKQSLEMLRRGESAAPMLFRMLKDQVEKDVAEFNRELGSKVVDFQFTPSSHFRVRHSVFPIITLDVTLKESVIEYRRAEKKSASADQTVVAEGEIFSVAGSTVDAAYYSIKGEKFAEERQVSEFLLSPIFQAVP